MHTMHTMHTMHNAIMDGKKKSCRVQHSLKTLFIRTQSLARSTGNQHQREMRPSGALVMAAAALAALTTTVDAASCTTLTENTLTSVGCPTDCPSSSPCVLYSPSQSLQCTDIGGAASKCTTLADFKLSDGSTCDVTYQCLDSIMYGSQWLLALSTIKNQDKVTMAYVTAIRDLKYDTANVQSV